MKEKELHEKANQEYDRIEKKFNQYRWNNDFEKAINAYAWMIRKLFYKNVDDYDNDYGLNKFKKMKLNFRRSVYRYINPELDNKLLQKLHNILDESIEQKNYAPGKISYNKIIFVGNLIWEYGGKVDKKEEAKEIYDISLSEFETDLKYYNMENAKEICELFECGLALKRDGETGKMSYWYLGRINAICGNKIKWEPGSSANQYYDESVKNFRKALEVENFDDLKEDEIRKKLRYNYENLGDWRFYNGHNEGAISDYEEAIRVMENKEDEDLKRKLTKARALQNILSLTLYRSYKNVDHLDYTDIDKYKQIYAKNSDKDEPYHSLEEALVTLGINELAKGGIDAAQNAEPYLLPLEQTWDYDFFDNLIEIYELNRSTYNKEAKAKYEEFVADDFKYFINRICGSDPLTIRASSNVDGINAHTISRRLRSWILDLR